MEYIQNALPIPTENAQKILLNAITKEWNKVWLNGKNSILHSIRDDIFSKINLSKFSRPEQVTLTCLRIGHTKLTHQYILNNLAPTTCNECNEKLTVNHILSSCKKFDQERRSLKIPENIKLTLNSNENLHKVLKFLSQINLTKEI